MSGINSGGSEPWNLYTNSDTAPSQTVETEPEAPWRSSLGTSMDAISFGFVATAILISMFLVMAIFEHLFRPADATSGSLESGSAQKLRNQNRVSSSYASDFSVLMPGQPYPTYIAQPAPLPCPRESISWPPHEHDNC